MKNITYAVNEELKLDESNDDKSDGSYKSDECDKENNGN